MEYQFRYLEDRSPEYRHLWKKRLLPEECPQSDPDGGLAGSHSEPSALARLQIWCKPAYLDDWYAFLKSVDVPDYRQRFMELEKGHSMVDEGP